MEVKNFSNIQPLNGAMTRQILSDRIVLFKKMEIVMRGMNDSMEFIRSLGVKPTDAMMKDIVGIDDSMSQQSSVGVTKTASQDSIDVLDGRLTHVQETNQEISNTSTATLELMRLNFTTLNEQMSTANRISLSNMYQIADIVKNTNVLPAMAKDMADVKRNTSRL